MSDASLEATAQPSDAVAPVEPVPAKSGGSLGKLLRGGAWTLAGRVWIALAGIVGAACWARVLSLPEMGEYQFVQTLVIYAIIVGSLGFSLLVVRLTSAHLAAGRANLAGRSIARCLLWSSAGSLGVGVLYYLLAPYVLWKYPSLLANHGLISLWLVLAPVSYVMAESFRGLHNIRDSVLFGGAAFQAVFIGGALIFGWLTGYGFRAMLILAVCAAAANLAIGLLLLQRSAAPLSSNGAQPQDSDLTNRQLFDESLPLMLTLLFGQAIGSLDLWIVALWFAPSELAIYGIAARVVLVMILPVQIIQGVIPPIISELHELKKRDELEQLLRGSATVAAVPSFLAMLLILTTGWWMVPLLFTASFGPAVWTLSILTVGQLISVLSGSANLLLMMTGHQRPAALCGIAALALLAVLAAILGSVWGPNGVAVAAGISLSVYKISLALLGWRLLNVRCWVDPTLESVRGLLAQRRR